MKTAIQIGLEELQAEIDKWGAETPTPVRGALLRAREIFRGQIATERKQIEDAYNKGSEDMAYASFGGGHDFENSTEYYEQTYKSE